MTANFNLKERFSKQRLTRNIGLKIASLLVAVFLWFVVVNVTDPVITKTYSNVPVKIINSSVIENEGKTIEVIDDSNIISVVTVKASRNTIQELGSSIDNIVAVADLNNLSKDGTTVPVELSTSKYSDKIDSIRGTSSNIYVKIENRKTIQLPVSATTSGDIESGYILGSVLPNTNQVRISGPESVIDTITSANVDVQVTGFTGDISTQAEIALYDEKGNEVSKDNLTLNVREVRVDVEILATKKVPIYYATSGIPADGYELTGEVEVNPEVVTIAGSAATISTINSINVPSADLNVTGEHSNMMAVLDLNDYLRDGIRLADASASSNVTFTIYIEQTTTGDYSVSSKNISFENVPEGFEAEINSDETIEFTLRGLAQNLEKINTSKLNCRVDFDDYALLNDTTEFAEGSYICYLVMDLSEGVEVTEPVAVEVKLTKTGE